VKLKRDGGRLAEEQYAIDGHLPGCSCSDAKQVKLSLGCIATSDALNSLFLLYRIGRSCLPMAQRVEDEFDAVGNTKLVVNPQ
jgi:hypothetical protein